MRNSTLSIVVPAHNEEKRIGETLKRIGSYFNATSRAGHPEIPAVEVIVVINNTTDRTQEIVDVYKRKYPFIKSLNIPMQTGKGGAVAIGFKAATGDYIAFIDADGSSSPREIMRLYEAMIEKGADIVLANRYDAESLISGNMPLKRTVFSRLFNTFGVRIMFGLNYKDTQCGLKLFRADVAKELATKIVSVKWTFDLNLLLLAKYMGLIIAEVPTTWIYKEGSTLNAQKALISVPKEIFVLKWLEAQTTINRFKGFLTRRSYNKNGLLSEKWYPWVQYLG